jgi:cytochrome P450
MLARVSTQDADLHGRHIPAGERMLFLLAAANRDADAFEDPVQVKLDRRRNAHLTFGSGAHRCPGSPLARLEMRVALEASSRPFVLTQIVNASADSAGRPGLRCTGGRS